MSGNNSAGGDIESYRRLADIFHELLAEQSLATLLDKIADTLEDLVPYDTLTIYEADELKKVLRPVLARDVYAEEILSTMTPFGLGITGWAVERREPVLSNEAHLDERVHFIPGTPIEPEALICVPLLARSHLKGALNLYRQGKLRFSEEEFELAKRLADAAALALDNAETRAALEYQAQTDGLTGLYNHRFFHERLRAELARATRAHDSVAVVMLDIDDFKKLNDVFGHGAGDHVLVSLSDILRRMIRSSDVACRVGGEEFALILPSCAAGDAFGLAARLREEIGWREFDPAGRITLSLGIAQGPEHAMNSRELVACAEAAMMTAKARGKDRAVLFDEDANERPRTSRGPRDDVRSIAHLKMLQSLAGKLNRLNDVRQIGDTIANELRALIDYHNCRVYLAENDVLVPVAFRGDFVSQRDADEPDLQAIRFGEGIAGRVAATSKAVLIDDALECDFAVVVPGTEEIEESIVAVPLLYGSRVNGVIAISKLGVGQFDEDDVRLLEVLAGQASVALENARLYEAQRRQADNANALLAFSDEISKAPTFDAVGHKTVEAAIRLLGCTQASLWLEGDDGDFYCSAHYGFENDRDGLGLLRRKVSPVDAEALIAGKTSPFVVKPEGFHQRYPETKGLPLTTAALAPLPGDGVKGWIAVRQPPQERVFFTDERLRLLAGLAYQASHVMQKTRLYRDQKESAEIANALLDFSRELAAADGLDEVLERLVELSARVLGSPYTSVWLQDLTTGQMVEQASRGVDPRPGEGKAGWRGTLGRRLIEEQRPFVLRESAPSGPGVPPSGDEGEVSVAVAPMKLEGRLGCLVAAAALADHRFSEREMRLLAGIGDQAKLAINEASSFENLERTFLSTVEALANALEAKDEYTSSHTRTIVDMSLAVGAEIGMTGKELKQLELVALFHDIGKIGIPSSILLKPGPLTPEEQEVIRTHPELGEKILAPIERLGTVRKIVRHCHEHFDGSGYPDGKKGDAIPIEARVILVCDAFDAMTTDRPYRARLSVAEACSRLAGAAGTQFDPHVVETFLELLPGHPGFGVEGAPSSGPFQRASAAG